MQTNVVGHLQYTSRYPKFQHIEMCDKRSKLSWKALSLKRDFRKILTQRDSTVFHILILNII
jgi:hypothetical protein